MRYNYTVRVDFVDIYVNVRKLRVLRESLIEFDRPKVDPGGGIGRRRGKVVADIQKCSARPRQREHRDRPSSHSLLFIFPRQGRRPGSRIESGSDRNDFFAERSS